jgi:tetratricopeptide (TPR) repeat protein
VDGDGNDEIVVGGYYSMGVRGAEWLGLSIFTFQGDELTRQNCRLDINDHFYDVYGGKACPIHGAYVSLNCKSLPCQIDWYENIDNDPMYTTPYKLEGGRYISAGAGSALHREGMNLTKQKEYEPAAAIFAEAARQMPASAQFANDAGFAYFKMRKFEESVTWLKKAIEIDPKRAVAYLNLGDTYAEINRIDDARQAYAKYLELAPNSKLAPEVKKKREAPHPAEPPKPLTVAELHAEGLALLKQQKYEEAANKLGEAAKLDPANAEFANDVGYALLKYGSSDMAMVWLEQATQLDPKRAVAYLNLGDAIVKNLDNLESTVTAPAIRADARKLYLAEARNAYMKYLELAPNSKSAPDVKKQLEALPAAP